MGIEQREQPRAGLRRRRHLLHLAFGLGGSHELRQGVLHRRADLGRLKVNPAIAIGACGEIRCCMQRANAHVEAPRGKSNRHDSTARGVDELLERHATQALVDDPALDVREIEAGRDGRVTGDIHPMTLSASSRSPGGTVSPSAFAALRLITRNSFLGCSIGISAGFAPFNILST